MQRIAPRRAALAACSTSPRPKRPFHQLRQQPGNQRRIPRIVRVRTRRYAPTTWSASISMHSTNPKTPASCVGSPNGERFGCSAESAVPNTRTPADAFSRRRIRRPDTAHAWQRFPLAEHLLPSCPAQHRLAAKSGARRDSRRLGRLIGTGPVVVEVTSDKSWRGHRLSNQSVRRH